MQGSDCAVSVPQEKARGKVMRPGTVASSGLVVRA